MGSRSACGDEDRENAASIRHARRRNHACERVDSAGSSQVGMARSSTRDGAQAGGKCADRDFPSKREGPRISNAYRVVSNLARRPVARSSRRQSGTRMTGGMQASRIAIPFDAHAGLACESALLPRRPSPPTRLDRRRHDGRQALDELLRRALPQDLAQLTPEISPMASQDAEPFDLARRQSLDRRLRQPHDRERDARHRLGLRRGALPSDPEGGCRDH